MYISVPFLLYVAERSLRTCRSGHYAVKILKVTLSDYSFPFCQILGWIHPSTQGPCHHCHPVLHQLTSMHRIADDDLVTWVAINLP